ncbi:MAG: ABC transporter substrate-binding protein [Rhizobiales bacterium]|nr:ABC transporter substrate-binding protein [Hyphomicrobiales bacterium]
MKIGESVRSRLLFAPSCTFVASISIWYGFRAGADEIIVGVRRPMSVLDHIRSGRTSCVCAVAFALALITAGLSTTGLITTGSAAAQTPEQTPIRFSLDGRIEGPSALFLLPLDKGYYQGESLDVTVDDAVNAFEPISRVASGSYDMALADINAVIRFRDQNPTAPIRAIFMVYNRPPFAIVGRKSRGITDPKSLEGKRLGAPPLTTTVQQWPVFAKLNDVDPTKVTLEPIATPVRVPMLAAGQLDAALGYSFRLFIDLKDRGVPVGDLVQLQMADYKMRLYGAVIIVNSKFATDQPGAVRKFLRATVRGFRETIRNPTTAVEPVLRRVEHAKKDVEVERLRMAIRDNVITPEVKANGFGAVDPMRLKEAIGQIALGYTFKTRPTADAVFDASFLPPAAERRVN